MAGPHPESKGKRMSIFIQVLKDLVGMFMADARMTVAILILVAIVAALVRLTTFDPLMAGWVLLAGCIALLIISALSAASKARK